MLLLDEIKKRRFLKFSTEERSVFNKPYLKVFLSDVGYIDAICERLNSLPEVVKANISPPPDDMSNKTKLKPTLTIYPDRCFSLEECRIAVERCLSRYVPNVHDNDIESEQVAHFAEIEHQILNELDNAKALIDLCVAWFTNNTLRDKLLEKQFAGVRVRVIVFNDGINAKRGVDLQTIEHKELCAERGGVMHKKYCVIDNSTTICGSYNWTNNAEHKNDENIEIVKNNIDFASQHTRDFNKMWNEL